MSRLIYWGLCPECGGEVVRHDAPRYGFCRGNCGVLLNIPSYRETEKKISVISCKIGDGKQQKIHREEYKSLAGAIEKLYRKFNTGII